MSSPMPFRVTSTPHAVGRAPLSPLVLPWLVLLCLHLLCPQGPVCAQEGGSLDGRKLAVVVGVNTYRANSGLPNLQHAASDAQKLSAALRGAGYTVYEMTHEAARQPGQEAQTPGIAYIRDQIAGVLGFPNLGEKDAVLITLHGHGVQFEQIADDGSKTPRFYFCPADATIDGIKTANELTERNHLLPLDELYEQLAECRAATKLLVVDACRNDPTQPGVFRSGLASATLPKLPPPPGGTAAFFSCKPNQQAVEDPGLQQGVFSHFLVQGLLGAADQPLANRPPDGVITFAELSAYVANNTYAHVYDKYKVRQSPELRGDYDLNLPLARVTARKPSAAGMEFVRIQPGSFRRGSENGYDDEKPVRTISITRPFYAGKYEVTIGQVLTWLNAPGVSFKDEWIDLSDSDCPVRRSGGRFVLNTSTKFGASSDQPVQNISWFGALAFCEWCSQQDSKFRYRLPTEAEWEFMARAGSTTEYPWGDAENGTRANVDGNNPHGTSTKGPYREVTTKVGTYSPNAWGLYDTVGNVREWCSDWYAGDYYANSPASDPPGPGSGSSRVLRGGSWSNSAINARSADRYFNTPVFRYYGIGFRVVAE